MDSVNGWICIREAYKEEDESRERLAEIVNKIKARIKENDVVNEHFDFKVANGSYYLNILVDHNRINERPLDFIKWIAKIAPGSFGIVYFSDHRYKDGYFYVVKIAKGKLEVLADPFLSPLNPVVEE